MFYRESLYREEGGGPVYFVDVREWLVTLSVLLGVRKYVVLFRNFETEI